MKLFAIINIILICLILFFGVLLISGPKTLVGLSFTAPPATAECYFHNGDVIGNVSIEMCCSMIQKTFECKEMNNNFICYNAPNSDKYYEINIHTLNYCEQNGFEIN